MERFKVLAAVVFGFFVIQTAWSLFNGHVLSLEVNRAIAQAEQAPQTMTGRPRCDLLRRRLSAALGGVDLADDTEWVTPADYVVTWRTGTNPYTCTVSITAPHREPPRP